MSAPVRILHVDDNPFDAQLVAMALEVERERFPTVIHYVQSKEEYLAALAGKDFDLILSDYRMGEYDGDHALAAAREICPEIPFIMVTGELGEEMVIETLKRGATDYVLKDRIFRLVPAIKRALDEAENQKKRLAAERSLQEREEQYRRVVDNIHDALLIDDIEGRVVFANDRYLTMFGLTREELATLNLEDYAAPEYRLTLRDRHERRMRGEPVPTRFEYQGMRKDGTRLWLDVSVVPLFEFGRPTGTQSTIRDISTRKQAEEMLRESEHRLRATLEATPVGIVQLDATGHIIAVNGRACQMLGYQREQLLQMAFDDLPVPEERESEKLELSSWSRATQPLLKCETRFRSQDNSWLWVNLKISILRSQDGRFLGAVTAVEDITERKQAELALEKMSRSMQEVLESVQDPLYGLDRNWCFAYVNPKAEEFLGIKHEDLLGGNLWELFPKLQGTEVQRHFERVMSERVPVRFEFCSVINENALEVFAAPKEDGGVSVLCRDITSRNRVVKALLESEERFHAAVDNFPHMYVLYDADLRIQFMNKAGISRSGYEASQVIGRRDEELFPPDATDTYLPRLRECRETRIAQTFEAAYSSPAGKTTITVSYIPLSDETGNLHQILGIAHDITERKQIEEALRRANQDLERQNRELEAERIKWQNLIEGIVDEVWACDANGKVSVINLATKTNLGLMDFDGRSLREVLQDIEVFTLDGRPRPDGDSPLLRALRGGVQRGEEFVRNRKTGTVRIRQYSSAPVIDASGSVVGAVAVVRDVTEERKAQEEIRRLNEELEERVKQRTAELERANRELESFSYSVSHDLKAPLRLISGFASLIERQGPESLTVKQLESLATIREQAAHMDDLIRALLEFSRIARKEPALIPVDTCKVAQEVIAEQRQLLGNDGGGNIQVQISGLPVVHADAILLRMVFTNLLSNAFKFTRTAREPRITIRAIRENGSFQFCVADNGVGFSSGQTDKLFKVFQRLHSSGDFEGSGVGLANVRKIIERHGGRVWAEGEEGRGAAFFFTLPAATSMNDQ